MPSGIHRILIIRPSAIGDIVMASPLIKALREAYPKAHLAWLIESRFQEVLYSNPFLDQLIVWPKDRWKQLWEKGRVDLLSREIKWFRAELRGFDLVVELQGLLRSRLLAWLSGAPERIGFASKEPGKIFMSRVLSRGPESKRMSSEYAYMARFLCLPVDDFKPHISTTESDRSGARTKMHEAGLRGNYAVLAPFTTRPQKRWVIERWGEISEALKEEFDLEILILGGGTDLAEADAIESLARNAVYNLTGSTPLGESLAAVQNASLLVGVDTGLTHAGTAFAVPTVALFGPTCPYLSTPSDKTRVLYHPLPCSPCKRSPVCNGDFTCMKKITVEEVLDSAKGLLDQSSTSECISST